jgi:hypothetical protein
MRAVDHFVRRSLTFPPPLVQPDVLPPPSYWIPKTVSDMFNEAPLLQSISYGSERSPQQEVIQVVTPYIVGHRSFAQWRVVPVFFEPKRHCFKDFQNDLRVLN